MGELFAAVTLICTVIAGAIVWAIVRRRPRKINKNRFAERWSELQKLCRNKQTWKDAVIMADDLLDSGLRKTGVRGASMGERLVKIQRQLTDNDATWFGHKLRRELEANPDKKLKENDVKRALVGIRQALKDIGALPNGK